MKVDDLQEGAMPTNAGSPPLPGGSGPREPGELLVEIAQRRDREAFAELFQRFERQAFNLARHLTGDRDLAEEAVQEGFLRIWLSAKSFRVEGTARGWMLRIIAGKSLEILRRRRRQQRRQERPELDTPDKGVSPRTGLTQPEGEELQEILRRALAQLPEAERQLVTLYYCGEFTQEQIAGQLGIPKRTISHHLQQAVLHLRRTMAASGLGLTLDALDSQWAHFLAEAEAAPPGLLQRTLDGLAGQPRAGGLAPGIGAGGWTARWAHPWAKAGLAAASLLALGLWAAGDLRMVLGLAPTAVPAAAGLPGRIWNFENGPAPDLQVVQNSWRWARDSQGRGCMLTESSLDRVAGIRLPVQLPARPFLLRFRCAVLEEGRIEDTARWSLGDRPVPSERWLTGFPVRSRTTVSHLYFLDRYVVEQVEGRTCRVSQYPQPYPSRSIVALFGNVAVQEIEWRCLAPEELRALNLDPARELETLKARNATCYQEERADSDRSQDVAAPASPSSRSRNDREPGSAPSPSRFSKRWSFETCQPEGLSLRNDRWQWLRLATGEGAMLAHPLKPVGLFFQERFPRRPFKMILEYQHAQPGPAVHHAYWVARGEVLACEAWKAAPRPYRSSRNRSEFWFIDRYVVQRTDGRTQFLQRYGDGYPGNEILFQAGNIAVTALGFEEFTPAELEQIDFQPEREVAELLQNQGGYGQVPAARRGEVGGALSALNLNAKYYAGEAQLLERTGSWSFARALPPGMETLRSRLLWRKGADGSGEAIPEAKDDTATLLLPQDLPDRPYVLSVRLHLPSLPVKSGKEPCRLGLDACWSDGQRLLPHRIHQAPVPIQEGEMVARYFFMDRYLLQKIQGRTLCIYEYTRPYPAKRIALLLKGWAVREMLLEAAGPEALRALAPKVEEELQTLRARPGYQGLEAPEQLLRPLAHP